MKEASKLFFFWVGKTCNATFSELSLSNQEVIKLWDFFDDHFFINSYMGSLDEKSYSIFFSFQDEQPPIPDSLSPGITDFLHQCFKKVKFYLLISGYCSIS